MEGWCAAVNFVPRWNYCDSFGFNIAGKSQAQAVVAPITISCSDPRYHSVLWRDECPNKKLDLLQVPAGLPAELSAGSTEIMGAEALDPDLPGGFGRDGPDRPVAQATADLPTFGDRPQQRTFLDLAAVCQALMPCLTHIGTATVRIRPLLPRRSARTQRFSRI